MEYKVEEKEQVQVLAPFEDPFLSSPDFRGETET